MEYEQPLLGIYFSQFYRVHEVHRAHENGIHEPPKSSFFAFFEKNKSADNGAGFGLFQSDLFMKNALSHADTHHIFSIFTKINILQHFSLFSIRASKKHVKIGNVRMAF